MRNLFSDLLARRVGFLLAFLIISAEANGESNLESASTGSHIVVQMSYYAQPGKAQDVLENRLRASAVLAKNGVTSGRVISRIDSPRSTANPDDPDVVWEGEFFDAESLRLYEKIAETSPEFHAARRKMSTLTRKTERRYYQVQ